MSLTVSLALLSIIQGGWRVDEAPLVPADWVIYSAEPVSEQVVAVVAEKRPATQPDASVPLETGVFTVRIGEAPRLIGRFSAAHRVERRRSRRLHPDRRADVFSLEPHEFELDLRTHKRRGLPEYPWRVLDCPNGGWTSPAGTMVTDCTDPDEARAAAQKPIRELPEAVGLSETQVFVMELEPKHPYRWYRGASKGRRLPFIVDGPSVLTFGPKCVSSSRCRGTLGSPGSQPRCVTTGTSSNQPAAAGPWYD